MLNYEKILVAITYRKMFEGLLQREGEVHIVIQVRHIAHTPVVNAVIALGDPIIVRHFLCS
jgi:hypothetical protein